MRASTLEARAARSLMDGGSIGGGRRCVCAGPWHCRQLSLSLASHTGDVASRCPDLAVLRRRTSRLVVVGPGSALLVGRLPWSLSGDGVELWYRIQNDY